MRHLFFLVLAACASSRPVTVPTPPPGAALTGGVDTHLHLTMSAAARPFMKGEPGEGPLTTTPSERLINGVSEAQLHATGVKFVFGGLWPPLRLRPGRSALAESLHQVRELDDFMGRRPGFALAANSVEVRRIVASGRIAVLAQVWGALQASGVPRASLDGMAERLLKLVEKVEGRADESAQAQAMRRHARVRDERSVLDVP